MCLHELQDVILIFIRPVEVNAKQNTLYVYLWVRTIKMIKKRQRSISISQKELPEFFCFNTVVSGTYEAKKTYSGVCLFKQKT